MALWSIALMYDLLTHTNPEAGEKIIPSNHDHVDHENVSRNLYNYFVKIKLNYAKQRYSIIR